MTTEQIERAMRVARLVDRTHKDLDQAGFGARALRDVELRSMMADTGVRETDAEMSKASLRFWFHGDRALTTMPGLKFFVRNHLRMYEVGYVLADGEGEPDDLEAYALVGGLSRESLVAKGWGWAQPRLNTLREVDPAWVAGLYGERGREMLEVVMITQLELIDAAPVAGVHASRIAFGAGFLARLRGRYERATDWFKFTLATARGERDWTLYVRSLIALATTYRLRGNLATAARLLRKARRVARLFGLAELEGMAWHDLVLCATYKDDATAVRAAVRGALRAYGPLNPARLVLAADAATFWVNRGQFAQALPVYRALLQCSELPAFHHLTHTANMAEAAAGLGNEGTFAEAWVAAWRMVERHDCGHVAAAALIDLARASVLLGKWDLAQRAASEALDLARHRGEHASVYEAERMLEKVTARVGALERAPAAEPLPCWEGDADLVCELTASLRR